MLSTYHRFRRGRVVDRTGAGDIFIGSWLAIFMALKDPFWAGAVASAFASLSIRGFGLSKFRFARRELFRRASWAYKNSETRQGLVGARKVNLTRIFHSTVYTIASFRRLHGHNSYRCSSFDFDLFLASIVREKGFDESSFFFQDLPERFHNRLLQLSDCRETFLLFRIGDSGCRRVSH